MIIADYLLERRDQEQQQASADTFQQGYEDGYLAIAPIITLKHDLAYLQGYSQGILSRIESLSPDPECGF